MVKRVACQSAVRLANRVVRKTPYLTENPIMRTAKWQIMNTCVRSSARRFLLSRRATEINSAPGGPVSE